MKFTKIVLMAALTMLAALMCPAQNGFDFFGIPRTLELGAPLNYTNSGTAVLSTTFTNGPYDLNFFTGIGKVDITIISNKVDATTGVAASLTATLEQSDDQTTWTAITTAALANRTSITFTNGLLGTNTTATDIFQLPGTNTTPTASSAGFATPYLVPANFNQTASVVSTTSKAFSLGIPMDSTKRYIHVIWTVAGSNVTYGGSAFLTGRRAQ